MHFRLPGKVGFSTAGRNVPLTLALWLLASVFFATTAQAQEAFKANALPPLRELPKDRAYELRVLYLEDARLPSLETGRRRELYAKIERLLADWYGYRVTLTEVNHRGLRDHFSTHEKLFTQQAGRIRQIDIDLTEADGIEALQFAIARDFHSRPLRQIESYVPDGPFADHAAAIAAARRHFLQRLNELRAVPQADGKPFFDATQPRLNSYAHWAVLLEEMTEADFVLTNSMILGADHEMTIYVIARGGLTTGVIDNNPHRSYQAATMVGLFPFLSDAPIFLRERGRIPADELLEVIATFVMHEMGHLFLRYDEHYDHPHCVHVAPTGLNYYAWHQAIRANGPCPLAHRKVTRF